MASCPAANGQAASKSIGGRRERPHHFPQRSLSRPHAGDPHPAAAPPPLAQELSPGAEQKVWVQSQTTFAVLHKEEDGSLAVRVVKQKIWVDGVSYELQVRRSS